MTLRRCFFKIGMCAVCCYTILLASCGGYGSMQQPSQQQVTFNISPSSPTMAVNSSLNFEAVNQVFSKYTNIAWSIEGFPACSLNAVLNPQDPTPPGVPCPSGWIATQVTPCCKAQTIATYHSPSSPGTYRIVVDVTTPEQAKGQATATVTVTAQ